MKAPTLYLFPLHVSFLWDCIDRQLQILLIVMFYLGVRLFLFLYVDLSSHVVAYILFHYGSAYLLIHV